MTNLILRGRGQGKTHDLIITSHTTGIPIVCHNENAVRNVKKMAHEMGYNIPEPMSITTLKKHYTLEKEILVDDLDFLIEDILNQYFGTHVRVATMTTLGENYED